MEPSTVWMLEPQGFPTLPLYWSTLPLLTGVVCPPKPDVQNPSLSESLQPPELELELLEGAGLAGAAAEVVGAGAAVVVVVVGAATSAAAAVVVVLVTASVTVEGMKTFFQSTPL